MTSINMICFEHNMEMIEVERSYISNMINLEYKGGVLNEDTEIVYEGVLETIKNAILAVLRKIRELFESVIDFFRRKKNTEEDKKVEEVAKKAEENLNNSNISKTDSHITTEHEQIYLKPIIFAFSHVDSLYIDAFGYIDASEKMVDNLDKFDDISIDEIVNTNTKVFKDISDDCSKQIGALRDSFAINGFSIKIRNYQDPIYKDYGIIDDIRNAYTEEKLFLKNIEKEKLKSYLKKYTDYFREMNNIEKQINPLKAWLIRIKLVEKKFESSTNNKEMNEETAKKMSLLKQFVNELSMFTHFVVKEFTTIFMCEKANIKYNISAIFRMSKTLS